jgi:hypothetical protein
MPYFLLFGGRYLPHVVHLEQVAKYEQANKIKEATHW